MYRVYAYNQVEYCPLYEPLDEELRIFNPILTQELGCAGKFEFQIMSYHPYYHMLGVLKTEVLVYSGEKEVFRGRLLKPETSMENIVSIVCEGNLTYLLDSLQRPYEFTGGVNEFIYRVLEVHNSQVDDFKKIYRGNIVVASSITASESGYVNSLDTLKKKLVDVCGGYLRIRHEDGRQYLDYLWDYGGYNGQVIRFGENLLDLNHYIDATSLITCLIPTGAPIEYTDNEGKKGTRKTDISAVNNGLDYIQNDEAVNLYGKVWGYQSWNDITDPDELLKKAKEYLKESSALPSSIEVSAIDLSLINQDVREFELGYWTQISSTPHGIEEEYMLSKRVINLLDPTQGNITLGENIKTFTESVSKGQSDTMQSITDIKDNTIKEIEGKIENATDLITGGLGGYIVIDNVDPITGKDTHPWRILIMNTPDKKTARNVIQFNQNGIGFSTNGINGPYKNAWGIDGNLIADFITGGTMLADRIRGGTMELGGKGLGKDGILIIKDEQGTELGRFDKTGITIKKGVINITSGSIDLGAFKVSSSGVLTLEGTSNNTSVGANLVNTNTMRIADHLEASGATFNLGGMWNSGSYTHGSFMGDFHGTFYETSDRRKKEHIRLIKREEAMEVVSGLTPMFFTMKETGENRVGFIAQDVEMLRKRLGIRLPLTAKDRDGYYCIPYSNYVALLTGAIQEQQEQIERLEREVANRWLILLRMLIYRMKSIIGRMLQRVKT